MRATITRLAVECDRCNQGEEFAFESDATDAGWEFNVGPTEDDVCPACSEE